MDYTGERMILESPECAPGTLLYQEHVERYRFAAKFVNGKRVLDLACGVGYGADILLGEGKATAVLGGDISAEAVTYAREHFKGEKDLTFEILNAEKLSLKDSSFDAVVSFETLEHLPHVGEYLTEVARVLIPGGIFIASTPNREVTQEIESMRNNPFHFQEYSKTEYRQLLGSHFNSIEMYYQRDYKPGAVGSVIRSASKLKNIYRAFIPRFIRVDLRNKLFPPISTDFTVYPDAENIRPLNYIAVCRKKG